MSTLHHVDFTVPQREWIEGLPFGTRGGTTFTYRFPVDGEYTIRVKLQRVELAILGLETRTKANRHGPSVWRSAWMALASACSQSLSPRR